MKVPPSLWASLSPGAVWAFISLYLYSVTGRCFISMPVQKSLPLLVAQNISHVSSATMFTVATYRGSMLARTSPVPVLAQRCQGWVDADKDGRTGKWDMMELRRNFRCFWGNRAMVEATAAVALTTAPSLSTPIPSSLANLAFQGFDKDKIWPFGYPSYLFWMLCIPSFPLILQKLSEAVQFSFYSSYICYGCSSGPAWSQQWDSVSALLEGSQLTRPVLWFCG